MTQARWLGRLWARSTGRNQRFGAGNDTQSKAIVGVRIVDFSGTCSRGNALQPGQELVFHGNKVKDKVCGPALHAILPVVRQVRQSREADRSARVRLAGFRCPLSDSRVIFQVFCKDRASGELRKAA